MESYYAKAKEIVEEEEEEGSGLVDPSVLVVHRWNNMIRHLQEAERIWEEDLKGTARKDIEVAKCGRGMKAFSASRTAKFSIMLSKLVDFWRGFGGLGSLIVNEEKKG